MLKIDYIITIEDDGENADTDFKDKQKPTEIMLCRQSNILKILNENL